MKTTTALALSLALTLAAPARADTTFKIATLAPEGSSWMRLFHEWARNIETRTEGRVKVKFYAGGVAGDERDVLRKIRLGQLSGAAITGIGLSVVSPEVRALEIARTYDELDHLRAALDETLKQKFIEKGYVLIAWGDVGPVHVFSGKPIRSLADLHATKMWQWSDDPLSNKLFEALEMRGVPLGVPDVLPALSTGAIDAFFGSPLSTLALQWSTHAKYFMSMVMEQASGATLVAKKAWDTLTPGDQQIVRDEASGFEKHVLEQVRSDNTKALASMKQRGLEEVKTPPELEADLRKRGEAVAVAAGASFSPEFQARVRKLVEDYRAQHKN
jgi:TRAP-type C4-dicarboxylate transport system substrate-binding protein